MSRNSISKMNLCLVTHISTKKSQIMCLINVHILICQYAKCDCRLWKVLWFDPFFWEYSYTYHIVLHDFIKLLQIMCKKVNLCNHLWLRQPEFYWCILSKSSWLVRNTIFYMSNQRLQTIKMETKMTYKKKWEEIIIIYAIKVPIFTVYAAVKMSGPTFFLTNIQF